jgi:hypothetical protein
VARCSTRRHCSSTVAAIPEGLLCNSWSFGGLFCKFGLFNNLFICFEFLFCIMDVKKKEKEKKKYSKEMCVFVFLLCILLNEKEKNEFNILIYMHKYLKDR